MVRIAIDFCGRLPTGEMYLTINRNSRYPIVKIMKSTTATAVKNRLNNMFAMFGYPSKVWSDTKIFLSVF